MTQQGGRGGRWEQSMYVPDVDGKGFDPDGNSEANRRPVQSVGLLCTYTFPTG